MISSAVRLIARRIMAGSLSVCRAGCLDSLLCERPHVWCSRRRQPGLAVPSGRGRTRAAEDGAHRRGPPLATALRGSHPVGVQPSRDLAEAATLRMLIVDASDELRRNPPLSSRTLGGYSCGARPLGSLG